MDDYDEMDRCWRRRERLCKYLRRLALGTAFAAVLYLLVSLTSRMGERHYSQMSIICDHIRAEAAKKK